MKNFFKGSEVIFEWDVPADYPNFSGVDDLAKRFIVVKHNKADGGVIVFGHYGDSRGWVANSALRPLVRHLLALLESNAASASGAFRK